MAHTSDPNLLSTQELIEAVIDQREGGSNVKVSTMSTGSLSSNTSKAGRSCNSRKGEGRKRGRKRKASERRSVDVQATPCKPAPIVRRLSADKSHFKEIVHQFTGLPCPPVPPPLRLPVLSTTNSNLLAAAIAQSLQTLDTISAYLLLHGSSQENNILLNEINKSKSLTFLQAMKQHDGLHKGPMGILDPSAMGTCNSSSTIGGVNFKSLLANHQQHPPKDTNLGMSGSQELPPRVPKSQQIAELEHVSLKENNMSDNFSSLAWVLLKQMASQPAPMAL